MEMNLGSMVMILRPGFRDLNGNHPVILVRKNASIKIQHQGDDYCFFYLDVIVRSKFVPRNTTVNCECYKGLLERLRNYCIENDLWNGQTDSFSIMTTLRVTHRFWYGNFCQTKIPLCVIIHLIHRIWHRATSGSSKNSKWPRNLDVLNRFTTSSQPRQRNWRHSRKVTSRTASPCGKNNGMCVRSDGECFEGD